MSRRLEGKIAAVTAAAAGIGRATSLRLAAEGAALVLNDIDADALRQLGAEVEAAGGTAVALPGDVTRSHVLDLLVDTAVRHFGRLDVLHNNAGGGRQGALHEITDEAWRAQFALIVDAAFYGTRAALRVMRAQRAGVIINTGSGAALAAEYGLAAYGAAKAALVALTRSTAIENAAYGIRANAICPGTVRTPAVAAIETQRPGALATYAEQLPQRRLGEPEEIAAVVAFLASDDASHINGAVISIDGGVSARRAAPPIFPDWDVAGVPDRSTSRTP